MNFNSIEFLIFFPLVIMVHWLLPSKLRKYWLLAASYFFYLYWNPILILLLLFSTAVDYFCSLGMEKFRGNKAVMKALLLISIFMNLGLLFTFKYADFFGETVNHFCAMLSIPYRVPALNLILPVGISFYTFQTMSYTIDVYRGDYHAERDPVTFALYVTFFPQLVAGPIERPQDLMPQLKKERFFQWDDLSAGIRLMLSGFFRKLVIADTCGIFVNQVFNHVESANALALFLGALMFSMQIYCDFSGYSEIANGAARMMGVRLTKNFNYPFLAVSYSESFRRWHITLDRWFTQYLYIPLGGSRKGLARKILNMFIVFSLSGLWHGANWTYVLWGLHSAVCLSLEGLYLKPMEKWLTKIGVDLKHPLTVYIRRIIMYCTVYVQASVLFRAESLEQIILYFTRMFTETGFGHDYFKAAFDTMGLDPVSIFRLVLGFVILSKLGDWEKYDLPGARTKHGSAQRISSVVYFVIIIALSWIALLATHDMAEFAYFQF